MALPAGQITLTVEYAKDLKDMDWFGKQDPYAVITVGSQRVRTKTHAGGGTSPVWHESFRFNVINENTATVELYDEDTFTRDDLIGSCVVDLSKARMGGVDHVQAAVSTKKGKQQGFVSFRLAFEPNGDADHHFAPPPPAWAPYGGGAVPGHLPMHFMPPAPAYYPPYGMPPGALYAAPQHPPTRPQVD